VTGTSRSSSVRNAHDPTRQDDRALTREALLDAWSWLFLILILAFFAICAQTQAGSTFLFRIHNLQSISIAASQILLCAVAAVFIGGASLTLGQGTIAGTVIGAFIIAGIRSGLVFSGLPPSWQFVAVGLVIIVAVLVDQSKHRVVGGGRP
jgi:ribose transport system permease protein